MKASFCLVFMAGFACRVLFAADSVWMNNPVSGNWLNDLNWDEGAAWISGNSAIFGNSSKKEINIGGLVTAETLTFGNGAGTYLFTNGTIKTSGAIGLSADSTVKVVFGERTTLSVPAKNQFGPTSGTSGKVLFDGAVVDVDATDSIEILPSGSQSFLVGENGVTFKTGNKAATFKGNLVSGVSSGIDGGVNYYNQSTLYPSKSNAFTGQTRLFGLKDSIFGPSADGSFGAQPESPTDNIVIGSNIRLYCNASNGFDLHKNRDILLKDGVSVYLACANANNMMRIGGRVHSEREDETSTNAVIVGSTSWAGSGVRINTQDDRTNVFYRLQVQGRLHIQSGTTMLADCESGKVDEKAPFFISAPTSKTTEYSDNWGWMEVSNATLSLKRPWNKEYGYLVARDHAQVFVRHNGVIDFKDGFYLNGYTSSARLTLEDGGTFICDVFYGGFGSGSDGEVNLKTNGVLQIGRYRAEGVCTVNMDGGVIRAGKQLNGAFFYANTSAAARMADQHFVIKEGGVSLETFGDTTMRIEPVAGVPYNNPFMTSGAAHDGGLTVCGQGEVYIALTNAYNGPTRVAGGNIRFANGCMSSLSGEFQIASSRLNVATATSEAPFVFDTDSIDGRKLVITEAEALNVPYGEKRQLLRWKNRTLDALPTVVFRTSDGNETENGFNGYVLQLSKDGKSILLSRPKGLFILFW